MMMMSRNPSQSCDSLVALVGTTAAPTTPDSARILVGAAGNFACEKRHKTILHCFRDRTPSYTRSNSNKILYYEQRSHTNGTTTTTSGSSATTTSSSNQQLKDHTAIIRREPRRLVRPTKLTVLKSSSSRDLTRLMELERYETNSTTSSSTSSSSWVKPPPQQRKTETKTARETKMTTTTTIKVPATPTPTPTTTTAATPSKAKAAPKAAIRTSKMTRPTSVVDSGEKPCSWQDFKTLEAHVARLEQELKDERLQRTNLEEKLNELTKVTEDLASKSGVGVKRKKSILTRKKQTTNASSNGNSNGGGASVQPSKLVAWMKLSNLWKHRPSIETLKEQNIYNDEPCFDTEIELVLKHEVHKTVPKIVVDCCDLIEEKYRRASQPVEGIYRQCGDYNKIQSLRFRIDGNDYESLRQPNVDVHTLTGVLKLFLREIKSPLVSANEAKTFIGQPNQWVLTDLPTKIDILKRLIRSLPEVNRDTMEYLFKHFNKLTKVPLQQTSAETLSLSVTPSIFHTVTRGVHMQDIQTLLRESEIFSDCTKIMIEYHSRIFECTPDRQRCISMRRLRKTLSHPDLVFQNLF